MLPRHGHRHFLSRGYLCFLWDVCGDLLAAARFGKGGDRQAERSHGQRQEECECLFIVILLTLACLVHLQRDGAIGAVQGAPSPAIRITAVDQVRLVLAGIQGP